MWEKNIDVKSSFRSFKLNSLLEMLHLDLIFLCLI